MENCYECGGKVARKNAQFKLYGEIIGYFPAQVCSKCGETLFDEETSDRIDDAVKQKGLWALEAKTKVTKVGSSLAVILNKRLVQFLGLKKNSEVHLHPESKNKIIIEA